MEQSFTKILPKNYAGIAIDGVYSVDKQMNDLLNQKKIPEEGYSPEFINLLIEKLAFLDCNNLLNNTGIGEREGRIASSLVKRRNYNLGHGMGRAGDINSLQPKALGSTIIVNLTKSLVMQYFKLSGLQGIKDLLLVPCATGMSLSLAMLGLRKMKPKSNYVIFSRIDQKSCLKCISTANLEAIVVDMKENQQNDMLETDIHQIEVEIERVGSHNILAILSTNSCFAPRVPDDLSAISKLCQKYSIFHICNNAYGLYSNKCIHNVNMAKFHSKQISKINEEEKKEEYEYGGIDVLVSSMDKNFNVPVGGALIYSNKSKKIIELIGSLYPGRGSLSPILDLFITFLELGQSIIKQRIAERKELFKYANTLIGDILQKYNENIFSTPKNDISCAASLNKLEPIIEKECHQNITYFGSYLYKRRVSGIRVLSNNKKQVCGVEFSNYGTHTSLYKNLPYFSFAIPFGITKQQIDLFAERLNKAFDHFYKKEVNTDKITKQES